jgi:hypothetical protein
VLLVDDEGVVTLGAYVGKQRDAVAPPSRRRQTSRRQGTPFANDASCITPTRPTMRS